MAQDVNVKITVDTTQAQTSTDNYKKRLKELKDQMTQLQIETDGLSKASAEQRQKFSELSQEAGKIQDAMSDTAQQVKNLSDDYLGMTAALQGVQAGVGSITAVSGALSAFGLENEKANETIKKMTSLMSILQGVQAVSKALNKDSALMTALRAKSEKSLNKELVKTTQAETEGTAATATFTAAEGAATTGAITLKGAVKAVGTAIKSVPVIGWILAAISAIITLISLISDANDEEERGNDILEERKKKLADIEQAHRDNIKAIREENNELSKHFDHWGEESTYAGEAAADAWSRATGIAREYLETLSREEMSDIQFAFVNYKEALAELDRLQKVMEETDDPKLSLDIINQKRVIRNYEESILKYREAGYKYVKDEEAKTKAIAENTKKKEDAERKYQELVKNNLAELAELHEALYPADEEEKITEHYDHLLDLAIKYYGEESEQVKRVSELRIKALDDLNKKRDDIARDEQRKAEDEGLAIEQSKLKGRIAGLHQGTEELKNAQIEQDKQVEHAELIELQRHLDDKLISEEFYQSELDRITTEHATKRYNLEKEYLNKVAEEQDKIVESKWEGAQNIISTYGEFVNAAMEAELEAVKGNEEKENAVREKYAKEKYKAEIAGIAISTANAIMQTWENFAGVPALAAIQTAMLTALGMAQARKAEAAMDGAFKAARGGILGGQSHANGGTMLSNGVEAERGEAIINKRSTAAFAPLLSEINSYNGYGAPLIKTNQYGGGLLNGGVSDETIQRIVSATVAGVTSIPVVVSEHNITEAQRTVGITRDRSFI